MKKGIIGKKVGMTQLYDEDGRVIPVTVVEAGPCVVVQKKTEDSDGYEAVQLGFGDISNKRVNSPAKGHFDKADAAPKRTLREFRLDDISELKVGEILKADIFEVGERVDVVGTSKGKGFAGNVKRFNTRLQRRSHGAHQVTRKPGALAGAASPGRVFKGAKLPGHMGAERVTIQNLTVAKVDAENNLIAIKGAIPGPKGGVVCIQDTVKA